MDPAKTANRAASISPCLRPCLYRAATADGGSRCWHPATRTAERLIPPQIRNWISGHAPDLALPVWLPELPLQAEAEAIGAWPFHFQAGAIRDCDGYTPGAANDG